MCSSSANIKDIMNPYSDSKGAVGELHDVVDPLGSAALTGDKDKLDPGKLWTKPDMPKPPPPPPKPQAARAPDLTPLRRRNADGSSLPNYGSTLLTGVDGVNRSSMNLGSSTLLGT